MPYASLDASVCDLSMTLLGRGVFAYQFIMILHFLSEAYPSNLLVGPEVGDATIS